MELNDNLSCNSSLEEIPDSLEDLFIDRNSNDPVGNLFINNRNH